MFPVGSTGFSTFSTLAFLFALPLFFYRVEWAGISLFEKIGPLFGWLFLSTSGLKPVQKVWFTCLNIGFISCYPYSLRHFCICRILKSGLYAAVIGAVIALITSYGLGFRWWQMKVFISVLLTAFTTGYNVRFIVSGLNSRPKCSWSDPYRCDWVAVLTIYNVLNIETGRGLSSDLCEFHFLMLSFSRIQVAVLALVGAVTLGVAYVSLSQFNAQVDRTLIGLEGVLVNDNYQTSTGFRLEMYRAAIQIGADNP